VIFHDKEKRRTLAIVKNKRKFLILSIFDSFCELSDAEPKKSKIYVIENYNKFAKGVDRLNNEYSIIDMSNAQNNGGSPYFTNSCRLLW